MSKLSEPHADIVLLLICGRHRRGFPIINSCNMLHVAAREVTSISIPLNVK